MIPLPISVGYVSPKLASSRPPQNPGSPQRPGGSSMHATGVGVKGNTSWRIPTY